MEKVSILIPCYNDGRYIEETLASIDLQTWRNIEVIIVDDASDDPDTRHTLAQLDRSDKYTVLHQAHKGPSAARNLAFRHSTGAFILPLDADDCIASDYIEKAIVRLNDQPKAGVCYCQADYFGERTGRWELPDYSLAEMLVDNIVFVTSLIRREVFEQVGGYDESYYSGMEDYDFYLNILQCGWEIVQIPEVLFHYRIKTGSRSQTLILDQAVYEKAYQQVFEKHLKLYQQNIDIAIPALRCAYLQERQKRIFYQNHQPTLRKLLTNYIRRLFRLKVIP